MLMKNIKKFDLVIVSDYGHGLISKKCEIITKHSKFIALNAGWMRKYRLPHNEKLQEFGLCNNKWKEIRHESGTRTPI